MMYSLNTVKAQRLFHHQEIPNPKSIQTLNPKSQTLDPETPNPRPSTLISRP